MTMDTPSIRVGLLIGRLKRGGAETLVLNMLRQRPAGIELILYTLREGGDLWAAASELGPVHPLRRGGLFNPVTATVRLAQAIRRDGLDLLHSHMPRPGTVGRLAGKLAGIPTCYTEHNLQRAYGPWVGIPHRLTVGLEQRVFAVSRAVARDLERLVRGVGTRLRVIENGVDVSAISSHRAERERMRAALGMAAEEKLILNVANLRATKNHKLLLEAFADCHRLSPGSLRLAIAGRDSGEGARLVQFANELGIGDRVVVLGLRSDTLDLMAAADLFVLSSDEEGLPVALLEASAMGLASVCTNVGGIAEVLEDGLSGRLVPPREPTAMSRAIREVVENPELGARLGSAARERVVMRFSLERMVADYSRHYFEIVSSQS